VIADFGGIAKVMPVHAAFLGIVIFASIGLPLLNGFVGSILVLVGAFLESPSAAIGACAGVVLSAACLLGMYRQVAFGPLEHAQNRSLIDLSRREKAILTLLVVPIFWIGIYPEPFLRRIEPSVIEVLRQVDVRGRVVVLPETRGEAMPGTPEGRAGEAAP
jgi:NADH-quinone oxidoreductase subunit M